MKVTIEKIVYPGKSLIRGEGKTIFTDSGLPGETVEITVLEEKKNYIQAKTKNIIEASPDRTEPKCPHYQDCAPYQYIKYEKQLKLKKEQLKEILSASLSQPLPDITVTGSKNKLGYRNKLRLKLLKTNSGYKPAYTATGTKNKYTIAQTCHLASKHINTVLSECVSAINTQKIDHIKEIEIRESFTQKTILITLYCSKKADISLISKAFSKLSKAPEVKGIIAIQPKRNSYAQHIISGKPFIEETLAGKDFLVGVGSFFQVNVPTMESVLDTIIDYAKTTRPATIADLYCGTGLFGIILSRFAERIAFIESEEENISFLKANLKKNDVENYFLLEGTCQECFPKIVLEDIDMLIVDPPRRGVDKITLNYIITCKPQCIVYLSCNPTTLARDLVLLSEAYKIKKIGMYDFFAHTPHIETLVILEKLS